MRRWGRKLGSETAGETDRSSTSAKVRRGDRSTGKTRERDRWGDVRGGAAG